MKESFRNIFLVNSAEKRGELRSGGQPLVTRRTGVAFLYPPLAVFSFHFEHLRPCELLQLDAPDEMTTACHESMWE